MEVLQVELGVWRVPCDKVFEQDDLEPSGKSSLSKLAKNL
jgi:hypothetical protein